MLMISSQVGCHCGVIHLHDMVQLRHSAIVLWIVVYCFDRDLVSYLVYCR